jgi:hypothetical protein
MGNRKENPMISFRGGIVFASAVLVDAAIAIMLAAALSSRWVLLALIPVAMMVACVAMMAAQRRMPRGRSAARFGCCAVSTLSGATADPERTGANATPVSDG